MVDTAGIKNYRGPNYRLPIYYRPKKPVAPVVLPSEEEIARRIAANAEFDRKWLAKLNETGQARALEKIVDTEARIAVEGDTAMDDVPFGESGE